MRIQLYVQQHDYFDLKFFYFFNVAFRGKHSYNKKVNLEQWKQKYRGVEMGWNFDILDEWIDGFDEGEVKQRLREAIGVFKRVNSK